MARYVVALGLFVCPLLFSARTSATALGVPTTRARKCKSSVQTARLVADDEPCGEPEQMERGERASLEVTKSRHRQSGAILGQKIAAPATAGAGRLNLTSAPVPWNTSANGWRFC